MTDRKTPSILWNELAVRIHATIRARKNGTTERKQKIHVAELVSIFHGDISALSPLFLSLPLTTECKMYVAVLHTQGVVTYTLEKPYYKYTRASLRLVLRLHSENFARVSFTLRIFDRRFEEKSMFSSIFILSASTLLLYCDSTALRLRTNDELSSKTSITIEERIFRVFLYVGAKNSAERTILRDTAEESTTNKGIG